jgi:hypothetical protein
MWKRDGQPGQFPCRRDGVVTFLGTADKLRRLAEDNPHVVRGRAVIRPRESVLVSASIEIPDIEIFPPA